MRRAAAVAGLLVLAALTVGLLGRLPDRAAGGGLTVERDRAAQADRSTTQEPEERPSADEVTFPRAQAYRVVPDTLEPRGTLLELAGDHDRTWTVSADGRLLAAPVGRGEGSTATIEVVDVDTMQSRRLQLADAGPVADLRFAPDEDALLWLQHAGAGASQRLHRRGLGPGGEHSVTILEGPDWHDWRALPEGRVGAFAFLQGRSGDHVGAHVVLIDAVRGRLRSTARMRRVAAPVEPGGADAEPAQEHWPGLAWDVERRHLFLAHADRDRVTVFDLGTTGAIIDDVDLSPQPLTPAAARTRPPSTASATAVTRQAAVSADGTRLYLSGTHTTRAGQGMHERGRPLGVRAVDTDTWETLAVTDLPVATATVSPDGRRVLAAGSFGTIAMEGARTRERLWVLDAVSLEEVRFAGRGAVRAEGFSPDGRYAYLSQWGGSVGTIEVLDLDTDEVVGRARVGPPRGRFVPEAGLVIEPASRRGGQ